MTEPQTYTGAAFTVEPGAIVFLPEEDDVGFTEDEAYAFLSGGIDAVRALTAAADVQTGAMIAFIPSVEDVAELALTDEGAEPVDQLHITAVYLGDAADIEDDVRESIIETMTDLATKQPLIVANIFGFAVLNPDGLEPCLVANVGGEALADAHDSVTVMLEEIGIDLEEQHEPWLAHMTLWYGDDPVSMMTDDVLNKTGLITIDKIRVAFAGVVTDIPLGVDAITASHVFHLPGQHDQKSHGGLRSMASGAEVAAAKKLNKGKALDPRNPEEATIIDGIRGWTGTGASAGNEQQSSRHFKEGVSYSIQHDPAGTDTQATFARTVAGAPANAPELHRGMNGVNAGDVPSEGDTFDLGPTSFTSSRKVAEGFSTTHSPIGPGGDHDVVVHLKKGSRSLQIDTHAGGFKHEHEHVTMGRFKVTRRRESVDKKTGRTKVELDVEQVETDIPISFTGISASPTGTPEFDISDMG